MEVFSISLWTFSPDLILLFFPFETKNLWKLQVRLAAVTIFCLQKLQIQEQVFYSWKYWTYPRFAYHSEDFINMLKSWFGIDGRLSYLTCKLNTVICLIICHYNGRNDWGSNLLFGDGGIDWYSKYSHATSFFVNLVILKFCKSHWKVFG